MTNNPRPLPPGSTIGILGSGQLGRMLSLAAAELGLKCHIYSPDPSSPAGEVSAQTTIAAYEDHAALAGFAAMVDAVTYEFENVPQETAAFLAETVPVRPGPKALEVAQDRLREKQFIRNLGLDVADFHDITDFAGLETALSSLGGQGILKTRRFGYDGKGQWRLDGSNSQAVFNELNGEPAILEALIDFDRETSVIAARGLDGAVQVYDAAENIHENHILRHSFVPAELSATLNNTAREMAISLLNALDYVGVLAVEIFVCGDRLLINELAPRVHNSGHWTQDACLTGQFEQHIRAIAGWPLGDPVRAHDAVMTNLLGHEIEGVADNKDPLGKLHLYGKNTARAGRKMGHINRIFPLGKRPDTEDYSL